MVHAKIIANDAADGVMRLLPMATGAITYDHAFGQDAAAGGSRAVLHAGGIQQSYRFWLEL
jgi:hypothetical protein